MTATAPTATPLDPYPEPVRVRVQAAELRMAKDAAGLDPAHRREYLTRLLAVVGHLLRRHAAADADAAPVTLAVLPAGTAAELRVSGYFAVAGEVGETRYVAGDVLVVCRAASWAGGDCAAHDRADRVVTVPNALLRPHAPPAAPPPAAGGLAPGRGCRLAADGTLVTTRGVERAYSARSRLTVVADGPMYTTVRDAAGCESRVRTARLVPLAD